LPFVLCRFGLVPYYLVPTRNQMCSPFYEKWNLRFWKVETPVPQGRSGLAVDEHLRERRGELPEGKSGTQRVTATAHIHTAWEVCEQN
jgi:hypothetical protein